MTDIFSDIDATKVDAPVKSVTLLEDRAQVCRTARVTLERGNNTLLATGVTPLVADRTLRARINPNARLFDVQMLRRYRVKTQRPEKEREIRATIEEKVDELVAVRDNLLGLGHERQVGKAAAKALATQIRDRLVVGPFDDEWPKEVETLNARIEQVEKEIIKGYWQGEDQYQQIDRLYQELVLALQPLAEYQGALLMSLEAPSAGDYEVTWEYLVPCALWRPEYAAALDGSDIRWTSAGVSWQATGEDWNDIELYFSTARPALGAELPLLSDDYLKARDKTDDEKKNIQVSSRDEVISKTESAAQLSDTPPGLDDGGEARTFKVPEPVTVPSDGRPHRLTFEHWQQSAESERVCLAERAQYVFLRSLQQNASSMPLLAGPVRLTREGVYVGRSQIAFVAAGERFELSWGSEDGLVVLRNVVKRHEEKGLRKHHHHSFQVRDYLQNQTLEAQTLRLCERVPVSELAQINVEIDDEKTTGGFERDDQGVLSWKIALSPGEEKNVRLHFEVVMPSNVHWDG